MKTFLLSLVAAFCFAESGESLLSLADRPYRYERIRTITNVFCGADESSDECVLFERLAAQPVIDWERFAERAKTAAKAKKRPVPLVQDTVADQYGGLWVVIVTRAQKDRPASLEGLFAVELKPKFPGYKVTQASGGAIEAVEVLQNAEEWAAAAEELGLDPSGKPKKRRFRF